MNRITVSLLIFCVLQSASCEENRPLQTIGSNGESMIIGVTAGGKTVTVKLEENEAAQELIRRLQEDEITCTVDDYGGFEKVGPLGINLPRNDARTNVRSGDIVLYSGNQIVLFYGNNSWSYTRLGRAEDISQDEWRNFLSAGAGEIEITLSLISE